MSEHIHKAATLRTPEGVEFLAFFDFEGEIRDEEEARVFLVTIKRNFGVPLTLSYRADGSGDWQTVGDGPCAQFLASLRPDQIPIKPVILNFPDLPPEPEGTV